MKEWDSMGISEDWSKSRRSPKKLTVVLSRCHSGSDPVLRGKLCDEGKEIYQKSAAGSWFVFSLWKLLVSFPVVKVAALPRKTILDTRFCWKPTI